MSVSKPYCEACNSWVDIPVTAFAVPSGALEFWSARLEKQGAKPQPLVERFGERVLGFTDPDGMGLDFGKGMNVGLGRARAACGLNDPGKPFSWDMFIGKDVKARISHYVGRSGPAHQCDGIAAAGGTGAVAGSTYSPPADS